MELLNKLIFKLGSFKQRADLLRKNDVRVGYNSEIYGDVSFGSEPYLVELGNNVRIASGTKLITHDGGVWVLRNLNIAPNSDLFGKIKIGDNVHIGMNCIIMPNVKIGNNCIIGCSAVVTKDIPDNSIAVGVPAKVIESIDEYYKKNKDKLLFTKNMNKDEKKKIVMERFKEV